jgi:3-deoxy-D-manno-octulosonic-acid transferase
VPVILYNISLVLFRIGIAIASIFNPKARKWIAGRKGIFKRLKASIPATDKIIWIHCASLGEFEQGRPLIESLRKNFPAYKILLTFFSPSGYEARRRYENVDWIFYLPLDGPRNARRFLEITHPSLVIFVKYEFWYYYLKKIKYRTIPLILVSALFRPDMNFLKWYPRFQSKMLQRFNYTWVQNEDSKKVLEKIHVTEHVGISGDTRFDRVLEVSSRFKPLPILEHFCHANNVLVAGSTWAADESAFKKILPGLVDQKIKLIIAPHEIGKKHIDQLLTEFPGAILYSQADRKQLITSLQTANVLLIDNIGLLSSIYKYAKIAYIGGGFAKKGLHNVLEAAVYGIPVIIGPYYTKHSEAVELVNNGGVISIRSADELADRIQLLMKDQSAYDHASKIAGEYVKKNAGATDRITRWLSNQQIL